MKIVHFCFSLILIITSSLVWGARVIPVDMQMAQLKTAEGKQIVLSNKLWSTKRIFTLGLASNNQVFQLNNNARIRDDGNRFITPNKLPQYQGRIVAVRFDKSNRIQEIWILTNDEQFMLKQRNPASNQ